MDSLELQQLVTRARGVEEAQRGATFRLEDLQVLTDAMNKTLESFVPKPGACVSMSVLLECLLRDRYGMPAVCVAGEVRVQGKWLFRSSERLPLFDKPPQPGQLPRELNLAWKGHCWIEVGGLIVEVSLLRTARVLMPHSPLRQYVDATFGPRRAAFATPTGELPIDLRYRRRFVLTNNQVDALIKGEINRVEREHKASPEGPG
jgi:hypothetical protein